MLNDTNPCTKLLCHKHSKVIQCFKNCAIFICDIFFVYSRQYDIFMYLLTLVKTFNAILASRIINIINKLSIHLVYSKHVCTRQSVVCLQRGWKGGGGSGGGLLIQGLEVYPLHAIY